MRSAAVVMLVSLVAVGCASSSSSPTSESSIEEMRTRILELQRKAAVAEVELVRLRQQVVELERRLTARPEPVPAPAQGVGGVLGPTLPQRAPRVEVSELEVPPPTASPEVEVMDSRSATADVSQPVSADAQEVYDRGYTLYHQGRYVDAETSFRRFIQDHPGTDLTDNAQYWIGASRFGRGDFSGALSAFDEVITRYPTSNKVPDAFLKAGECLDRLGRPLEAAERYSEVIERFPGSAAASIAEEKRGSG